MQSGGGLFGGYAQVQFLRQDCLTKTVFHFFKKSVSHREVTLGNCVLLLSNAAFFCATLSATFIF